MVLLVLAEVTTMLGIDGNVEGARLAS